MPKSLRRFPLSVCALNIPFNIITAFSAVMLLTGSNAYSQADLKKIIPPSPTVSALARYGEIPVSYYTGTPNISIPGHEIKTDGFTIPVSLSYHASGVKVEEIASWVGLGWSLNAGGIISRSVRGLPDENGFMSTGYQKVSEILALPEAERGELLKFSVHGLAPVDMEPDLFTFNFGGHSGSFYYSQESDEIISVPRKAIFIDKAYFLQTGFWKIITEDGTEYHFNKVETNTNFSQCNGQASSPTPVVTGWFLTRIVTPAARREINFYYAPSSYVIDNIGSYTLYEGYNGIPRPSCVPASTFCLSQNHYQGYRIDSIGFDGGKIRFVANTARADVIGDKRLDVIELYSYDNKTTPYKKFLLGYDYFNPQYLNDPALTANQRATKVRLKLKSVTAVDATGTSDPPYEFFYNASQELPDRMSYSQDSWGYFNGKTNPHLVPKNLLRHHRNTGWCQPQSRHALYQSRHPGKDRLSHKRFYNI